MIVNKLGQPKNKTRQMLVSFLPRTLQFNLGMTLKYNTMDNVFAV